MKQKPSNKQSASNNAQNQPISSGGKKRMVAVGLIEGLLNPAKKKAYEEWLLYDMLEKQQLADHKASNGATSEEIAEAYRSTCKAAQKLINYKQR